MVELNQVESALSAIMQDAATLMEAPLVLLGAADPPLANGVYLFVHNDEITYVGEAKGSGGLQDRLLRKHLSGSDKHTLQRVFKEQYPDRKSRRKYLKKSISVRWVEISDPDRVAAVERFMIWLLRPKWNMT